VRVGPTTAQHDLQLKLKQARGFLEKDYRVKISVSFKRLEQQQASDMLARLRSLCAEFASLRDPAANEKLPRNTYAFFLAPK
jgi:translation initiation factor IF-3